MKQTTKQIRKTISLLATMISSGEKHSARSEKEIRKSYEAIDKIEHDSLESVFIVFKTDHWHSHSSRTILGACTSMDKAFQICQQRAIKEDSLLTPNEWNKNQSQGYLGVGEFDVEEVELNKLL